MSILEVTSLSTKGQIVIPKEIRKNLGLKPGTKLIVIQEKDNILLKPIKLPKREQFEKLISFGDKVRNSLNLKESDIEKAIEEVRKQKNENSR